MRWLACEANAMLLEKMEPSQFDGPRRAVPCLVLSRQVSSRPEARSMGALQVVSCLVALLLSLIRCKSAKCAVPCLYLYHSIADIYF